MFNPTPVEGDPQLNDSTQWREPTPMKLSPLKTGGLPWAEELEVNWSSTQVRDDLQGLRNFFKSGMDLTVVEEMVGDDCQY